MTSSPRPALPDDQEAVAAAVHGLPGVPGDLAAAIAEGRVTLLAGGAEARPAGVSINLGRGARWVWQADLADLADLADQIAGAGSGRPEAPSVASSHVCCNDAAYVERVTRQTGQRPAGPDEQQRPRKTVDPG